MLFPSCTMIQPYSLVNYNQELLPRSTTEGVSQTAVPDIRRSLVPSLASGCRFLFDFALRTAATPHRCMPSSTPPRCSASTRASTASTQATLSTQALRASASMMFVAITYTSREGKFRAATSNRKLLRRPGRTAWEQLRKHRVYTCRPSTRNCPECKQSGCTLRLRPSRSWPRRRRDHGEQRDHRDGTMTDSAAMMDDMEEEETTGDRGGQCGHDR